VFLYPHIRTQDPKNNTAVLCTHVVWYVVFILCSFQHICKVLQHSKHTKNVSITETATLSWYRTVMCVVSKQPSGVKWKEL
jgi:hypothetical protein